MNAKELIELNNEKRTHLNEANLAYYENMLIYIRSASSKEQNDSVRAHCKNIRLRCRPTVIDLEGVPDQEG
ncbi:hypothetical protein [Virgibacillus chiguensis]|uniref:Uncharacterized protein n=1 Tax=Virgibacillus chiguensis TaxID=411959 RepID=A0A1M5RQF6_9BACI|nr:hypothetical protein [Virgibacillus chiguensis]SHH28449.1 hypothetical protein SAMN05421807_105245 [Virgibacillus chiguensis]